MNEEFYATLKLITGEELFAEVCGVVENNQVIVILHHPIKITSGIVSGSIGPIIKVQPWNELSSEDMFTIPREHILTMNESNDKSLIKIHQKYVREVNHQIENLSKHSKITTDMGYVSNVKDAVSLLEKVYQMDSKSSCEPQD